MSGFLNALGWSTGTSAPGIDDISIVVGDQQITGWASVAITRSVELFPNHFVLTATDQYPYDAGTTTLFPSAPDPAPLSISAPGGKCQVFIGSDLVITGYVDQLQISVSSGQHQITITGRGLCEDLVDCSADLLQTASLTGATMSAANCLDLANKLCGSFGLTARCAVSDLGESLPPFTVALGETSYEIIERVARYCQYLVYEDEKGALVLDRVGTNKMASGFQMPGNIEGASSALAINQRYSRYVVLWSTINQYAAISPLANNRADVTDPTMPRYRPRIIVSEQIDPSQDIAQARANWELARRIGRSQAISLTCDSWRDSAGKLWTPNHLAPIDAAALKITNAEWIIGTVTFRKDLSGTHADIQLMPPAAFNPEPAPLNLWDRELTTGIPSSSSPAPPTTGGSPASSGLPGSV